MYVLFILMCVFLFQFAHSEPDSELFYEHIRITNYEDFLIRKELDADFDLVSMRPFLALKKIEKTIQKYPNRYRIVFLLYGIQS